MYYAVVIVVVLVQPVHSTLQASIAQSRKNVIDKSLMALLLDNCSKAAVTSLKTMEKESTSLKDHLLSALKSQARGKRAFELSILRSQPKRSRALFPWASDSSVKIYVEYEMIVLSEKSISSSERSEE